MLIRKYVDWLLLATPVILILITIGFDRSVIDTDALCYHLYYAKVINQLHLGFFSNRPFPLENTLGFGMSGYYPWLYSHVIAFISRLTGVSFSISAYLLALFMYASIILMLKPNSRILFLIFVLSPMVFQHLFTNGTNYFLIIFLSFVFYKVSTCLWNNSVKYFFLIAIGFLCINSHVFGLPILIFLTVYKYSLDRDYKILIMLGAFATYVTVDNFFLTGSPTFPFLQNLFPHMNYSAEEWNVVTDHLSRAIFWEGINQLYRTAPLLVFDLFILVFVWRFSNFKTQEKLIISLLMLPAFGISVLGFRHRIIFNGLAYLVFLDLFSVYRMSIRDEALKIFIVFKKNIWNIFYVLIVISTLGSIPTLAAYYFYEKTHVTVQDIKKCFYSEVSELSYNNKIVFTEMELMNIARPENIIQSDGKFYSHVSKLKSASDFTEYLHNNGIKYITDTPLSSDVPFNEKNAHVKFIPELLNKGFLKLHKDCVVINNIDNTKLPYLEKNDIKSWSIYEVK